MLIDDAVIVGGTPEYVINLLQKEGVTVAGIGCGIATQKAVDKFETMGVPVISRYILDSYTDVICERDLIPGFGGISTQRIDDDTGREISSGTPYLYPDLPRELMEKLINIPEKNWLYMTIFFYLQAIALYSYIEIISGRTIMLYDMPKIPRSFGGRYNGPLIRNLVKIIDDNIRWAEQLAGERGVSITEIK